MDGTTSSSLFELRLGHQEFGKETHAYSVAWADHEIDEALQYADKIIFNSTSQLDRFKDKVTGQKVGLRVNPGFSTSDFDLADPARPQSRLGESTRANIDTALISGVMLHYNCENDDFALFCEQLDRIEAEFGSILAQLEWVSLGGGIHFTGDDYPLDALADRLKAFRERYGIALYLEPGEAAITGAATLEVSVLDIMHNDKDIAIVDASTEAHMLDLLIYREEAKLPRAGAHAYQIAGKTCLAGDIFGDASFDEPLEIGTRISIQDAAGYTMVKKNWFNGLKMPTIALRDLNGKEHALRQFEYEDFRAALG